MLTLNGIDIEMIKSDEKIYAYLDGFFDFDSLMSYIHLTLTGLRKYKNETPETIIRAVLMCSKHNKDFRRYDMFYLDCKEWDLYFNELFVGFDRTDINMAIAELSALKVEELKNKED